MPLSAFLAAHAHDPALRTRLLEMARTGLAEHQERLRELFQAAAVGSGFFTVVRAESHKLANVTSVLLREESTQLANALESAARARDEGACREAWSRLDPEIAMLREAVESAVST